MDRNTGGGGEMTNEAAKSGELDTMGSKTCWNLLAAVRPLQAFIPAVTVIMSIMSRVYLLSFGWY